MLQDINSETKVIDLKLRVLKKTTFPGKKVDRIELQCTDGRHFAKVVGWGKAIKSIDERIDLSCWSFSGNFEFLWFDFMLCFYWTA